MFFYAIRNIMSNKSIPLCTFRPIFSGKPSFDIVVWLFEFLDEDNKFFVPINSVSPLPRLFEQEAGWQLKFSVDISDDNQLFVPINSIWIISRFLEHDAWLNIVLHSNFVNKNWHKQNRSLFQFNYNEHSHSLLHNYFTSNNWAASRFFCIALIQNLIMYHYNYYNNTLIVTC